MKNVFTLESQLYASLSHPKRLEILHLLSHKELSVGDITRMTGLSQANVSQHLMLLKKLKLVVVTKHAQQRFYALSSPHLSTLFDTSRSLLLTRFGVQELDMLNRLHLHIDPVCHMEVSVKGAAASLVHDGSRYYFCAKGCAKRFQKNPTAYLGNHQEQKETV